VNVLDHVCMYCAGEQFDLICFTCLKKVTEWKGLDSGNLTIGTGGLEEVCFLGKLGGTLEIDLDTGLGGLCLGNLIVNDTLQNFLLALGLSYVLNADMDALLENSSIDKLVDTDTDSRLGHVEDNSSASMVTLVWHTLVNGRVGKDVDVVTNLHAHEVLREVDRSMLPMLLGKHVARTRS
jgi:hypothetical protein